MKIKQLWLKIFVLNVGQEAIISYNQVLNYLEYDNQDDENLYKFRAITDHHGPLDMMPPATKEVSTM